MDRVQYNSCIAAGLKGKKMDAQTRRLEFCIVSKTCSGKARDRSEAQRLCSLPKPEKPEGTGKRRKHKGEAPAPFDPMTLMPYCEKKLGTVVRSGELPANTDVSGLCKLILG